MKREIGAREFADLFDDCDEDFTVGWEGGNDGYLREYVANITDPVQLMEMDDRGETLGDYCYRMGIPVGIRY